LDVPCAPFSAWSRFPALGRRQDPGFIMRDAATGQKVDIF
jgi:hypothetical protein